MGTITKEIAEAIIAGSQEYANDGITKIVTYNNMFDGGLTYAAVFRRDYQMKYEESPACSNVRVVWREKKDPFG